MANQIRFNVGFQVDRTGLNELQNSLAQVQVAANKASKTGKLTEELKMASKAASQLSDILNQSWNSKLGQLDLSRVNNEIKKAYGSVKDLRMAMEQGGSVSAGAYNQVASAILNTNLQLKQSNKLLDEMATSMANTVKWGITSAIFNNITGSIQKAYGYTKKLDTSLNDIRIVTEKSAESMEKFAVQANNAAKGLGASTLDYTQASLIYYQQGLSDEEVAARAETTLKAANVTGQSGEAVSEQLTAVWNGYKVTAQEAELYVDKLAAVAATTAADLEELSTGMSKVASAANLMGVDIDQLNAQLATIVSVTRQAPESVGTALKTIYARMGDIEAGIDTETTLGNYTEEMANMGFNVLDMNGKLRDMGEVIEEIGSKWSTMSREQQISLSQTVAGTRQYNNLLSLFDNWDMYTKAIETSSEAAGTLQKQQDIYMESTKAHLQQLSTEAEETYDILFDQDTVNGFTDALTGALGVFNNFLKSTGGGISSFIALGSIVTNIFNKQIGNAISKQLLNLKAFKENAEGVELKEQLIQDIQSRHQAQGENVASDAALAKEAEYAQQILNIRGQLTAEEYNELTTLQQQIGLDEQRIQGIEQYRTIARDVLGLDEEQIENYDELNSAFQNRIDAENTVLQTTRERRDLFNSEIRIYNDINASDEDRANSAVRLREIIEGISEEQLSQEERQRIINNLTEGNALDNEDILNIQRLQRNLTDEQRALVSQLRVGAQGVADAEAGVYSELINQRNAREVLLQQQIQEREQAQLMSNMTQGISTLTIGLTTISGIIKTINNESMSTEDKVEIIFSSLLTTLPMLISNFSSLRSIIPGAAVGLTTFASSIGSSVAPMTAAAASSAGFVGQLGAIGSSLGAILSVAAPYIAIIGAVVAVVWLAVKAHNADAEAAKKAAEAYKEAAKAAEEAKAAYEELANTMSEYKELADGIKELDESTQEYKDSLEQANEKAMDLIKSNKELAQYAKRNDQGLITFEGNEDKVEEILKEAERKANLAEGAENLAEINVNQAQLKSDRTDLIREEKIGYWVQTPDGATFQQASNKQLEDVIDAVIEHGGLLESDLTQIESLNNNQELINSIINAQDEIMALAEETKNLNATNELLYEESLRNSLENDEDYATMSEAEKNAIATIYGSEENLTDEIRNTLEQNAEKDIEEKYRDFAFGWGKEDDLHKDYAKERGWTISDDKWGDKAVYVDKEGNEHTVEDDSAREYLKNLQITESLADYDEDLKRSIESVVQKIYQVGEEAVNTDIASELLGFATKKDLSFDAETMTLDSFNQLKDLSANGMESLLAGVSPDEWKALGYDSAKQYAQAVQDALTPELEAAIKESAKQSIIGLSDDIGVLTKDFQSGDITSENVKENEEYQNIIKNLDNIKTLYPELTAAAEVFADTNLVGTQLWAESLYELQDAINEIELNDLKEQFTETIDAIYEDKDGNKVEFSAWLESDEFEQELDAIINADYAITVEVHSQAEDAFNSISAAMDNMEEMASKIGDDFIVAADDIRELNNAFPNIIENMENLGDGTVKLNEKIVQSSMEAAKAEVAADAQKTVEKLTNTAKELRAKQQTYQSMADAARALASGELETEDQVAEQKRIIEEGLSLLDKKASDNEMENDALVATNSKDNAGILADNWSKAYQSAAESAAKFAEKAVEAAKVATEGEGSVNVTDGDFKVNYQGKTGVSPEAKQIKDLQDLYNKGEENYSKLADSFQRAADVIGKTATDTEGMIGEVGARVTETVNGLNGVGSGRGYDNKKDSKGGGKEDKREEEYKTKEEEIDRYWELNKAIENVTEALSDLDKKQDKLHGKELIASLKEENKLLKQQAKAYQELAAEQRKEAGELQGRLMSQGVKFDKEGGVANYQQAAQAALDKYNQAVTAYNSFTIDEATFKAEQQAYENFKATLERYEELYYNEMRDTQNELDEIHRKELENNLQAWEIKIEVKLEKKELKREWNEFFSEINEDFTAAYEDLDAKMKLLVKNAKTYTSKNGDIKTQLKAIEDVKAEIDKMEKGEKSNKFESISQAQEELKKQEEALRQSASDMRDLWEESWDTYLDGIDQASDKLDHIMDQYDSIDKELEHQRKLIELLYGDEAYDLMDEYYKAQEKNTLSSIDSLKQQRDMWKQQYDQALARDKANGTTSKDTLEFYEKWQQAQDDLNGSVEKYIELLQDDYKNTIDKVISDLEKQITGGLGLDEVKEEWELLKEQSDKYYDDVERIYELSSLSNKYETSIASTSNLKNQQKLQKLYEQEMKFLEEKDNLSKHDLEMANAKYELTLKQIALEEAQQNKNAMKLVRGTDGNWSYQYVADQDEISKKQQDLMDASDKYYETAKDGYYENLDDMADAVEEYLEKIKEINITYMNDEETKNEKLAKLKERYEGPSGIITLLAKENQERQRYMAEATALTLKASYEANVKNYEWMTDSQKKLIDGLKDGTIDSYDAMLTKAEGVCADTLLAWSSAAQQIATNWNGLEKGDGKSVREQVQAAYSAIGTATDEYKVKLDALGKTTGEVYGGAEGKKGITQHINDATAATDALKTATNNLCTETKSNLDSHRTNIDSIGKAWGSVKTKIDEAIKSINEYLTKQSNVKNDPAPTIEPTTPTTNNTTNNNSNDKNNNNNNTNNNTKKGGGNNNVKSVSVTMYPTIDSVNAMYTKKVTKANKKELKEAGDKKYTNNWYLRLTTGEHGWISKSAAASIQKLKTGGYTGEWQGENGKLAFLHSKELVLNAKDTENILSAVDTVRQLSSLNDSINQSIMDGIGQMVLNLAELGKHGNYSIGDNSTSGNTIFEIQANFPNAGDVESIREAIMSLPNLASQYIARNRK